MSAAGLYAHLSGGTTTVCHAWYLTRTDGTSYGFTDHDRDLSFGAMVFRADTGMTARALQQTTGLSVDNSEAVGALSDAALQEADILAGRFDGAEVRSWLVNWADPDERVEIFRGKLGEITRVAGSFRAELRGLSDLLNQPQGRVYHKSCSAVLGDAACKIDLTAPAYFADRVVTSMTTATDFLVPDLAAYAENWFERGRLIVMSGPAQGLTGLIKFDRIAGTGRRIELWSSFGQELRAGDMVRLQAGCDKLAGTCRDKFANFANFRGFPHLPGEDWLTSYPVSGGVNDGGSMQS